MKIDDIHTKIMSMDSNSINELIETIKHRRNQLHTEAGAKFRVGVIVQFGRRNGQKRTGKVEKMNVKKAVINVAGQKWNVPFGMMELVK